MEKFVGKVAVVTGSSAGIGEEISKELLKEGMVVVGLARQIHKLQVRLQQLQELSDSVLNDVKTYKGKFHGLRCDIRKEGEIRDIFNHIRTNIGPITVLVNNAGVLDENTSTVENFNNVFDTNVKGLLLCTEEAMSSMKSNRDGTAHIINVNSICSLPFCQPQKYIMMYAASKSAIRTFSEVMRRNICKEKLLVKVTDISPGNTLTSMMANAAAGVNLTEMEILPPTEIAKVCVTALSTARNVLISELTIMPIHQPGL